MVLFHNALSNLGGSPSLLFGNAVKLLFGSAQFTDERDQPRFKNFLILLVWERRTDP